MPGDVGAKIGSLEWLPVRFNVRPRHSLRLGPRDALRNMSLRVTRNLDDQTQTLCVCRACRGHTRSCAHCVFQSPRGTTATLELKHKGNINDKTIPERDGEVKDFNATLLASAPLSAPCDCHAQDRSWSHATRMPLHP